MQVDARSPRGNLKSNTTNKIRFTTEGFPSSGVKISSPVEAMVDKKTKVEGNWEQMVITIRESSSIVGERNDFMNSWLCQKWR